MVIYVDDKECGDAISLTLAIESSFVDASLVVRWWEVACECVLNPANFVLYTLNDSL